MYIRQTFPERLRNAWEAAMREMRRYYRVNVEAAVVYRRAHFENVARDLGEDFQELVTALAYNVDDNAAAMMLHYIRQLPQEDQLAVVMFLCHQNMNLVHLPSIMNWAAKNAHWVAKLV